MSMGVEPVPETDQALSQLSPELVESLQAQMSRAQQIVPKLVGVSLASTAEGVTFTFVASSDMVAT
jgi:hypothetical protein